MLNQLANTKRSRSSVIFDDPGRLSDEVMQAIVSIKSWGKVKLVAEERLSEGEVTADDLENQAIQASEIKVGGITSASGESDLQSKVSIGIMAS